MGFNLNDYQTVAERLDEALKEHGDMRVITSLEHTERLDGRPVQYVMKAELWLGTTLVSTGWAEEIVGNSPVNKTSALENCETSAVGRALANFGFQGKNPSATRPSRNEMEKVERVRRAEQEQIKQGKPLDWGEPTKVESIPIVDSTWKTYNSIPNLPADDPFATWNPIEALGAEVIEIKATPRSGSGTGNEQITDKQMGLVRKLFKEKHPDGDLGDYVNMTLNVDVSKLSEINKWDASKLIDSLKG